MPQRGPFLVSEVVSGTQLASKHPELGFKACYGSYSSLGATPGTAMQESSGKKARLYLASIDPADF